MLSKVIDDLVSHKLWPLKKRYTILSWFRTIRIAKIASVPRSATVESRLVYILKSSLSYDIMPKSIDQDGEAFGALRDTFLYLL